MPIQRLRLPSISFFGLFGMYYSLQYLSLSDAVVLTFLTPTVTAIVGHFVLKEGFTRGQTVAGCMFDNENYRFARC